AGRRQGAEEELRAGQGRAAFVVNRLLTRFLGEIIGCVDEGTPLEVAEHAPDPLARGDTLPPGDTPDPGGPRPSREAMAGGDRPSTAGEVRERALEALAEEIRLML